MLRPLEVIRAYPPHDATLLGLLESRTAADSGEIWVRTPILMQGYYRDPEQSWARTRSSSRW